VGAFEPQLPDNGGVQPREAPAAKTSPGGHRRLRWTHRGAIAGAVVGYALVAAVCRPLTWPALVAVLAAGAPLAWYGVRHRPSPAPPVGRRSAIVWMGLGSLAALLELGLRLGPDDLAHPTLSTLVDPALAEYPGRVVGYVLWLGVGVWLVRR
jgi:hypothetical protein